MGCFKLQYYTEQEPFFLKVVKPDKEGDEKGVQGFLSVDPLTSKYPMLTPYQFASLNPIRFIDIDGLEGGEPPKFKDKPKVKVVSQSEVNVTIGPQAEMGVKGIKGKGLGLDLTIVSFNILKISITETIDLKTRETSSDWSLNWFSGDVESSVGVKTPVGTFSAKNMFQIDPEAEYIPGTQKTEYSYVTPKTTVKGIPVEGQVTYTEMSTGETSVKAGAKTSASLKFILGVSYSSESAVEAEKKP